MKATSPLSNPLNLNELSQAATKFDDRHRMELVTQIGGWEPWINGGGWLMLSSNTIEDEQIDNISATIRDDLQFACNLFSDRALLN